MASSSGVDHISRMESHTRQRISPYGVIKMISLRLAWSASTEVKRMYISLLILASLHIVVLWAHPGSKTPLQVLLNRALRILTLDSRS